MEKRTSENKEKLYEELYKAIWNLDLEETKKFVTLIKKIDSKFNFDKLQQEYKHFEQNRKQKEEKPRKDEQELEEKLIKQVIGQINENSNEDLDANIKNNVMKYVDCPVVLENYLSTLLNIEKNDPYLNAPNQTQKTNIENLILEFKNPNSEISQNSKKIQTLNDEIVESVQTKKPDVSSKIVGLLNSAIESKASDKLLDQKMLRMIKYLAKTLKADLKRENILSTVFIQAIKCNLTSVISYLIKYKYINVKEIDEKIIQGHCYKLSATPNLKNLLREPYEKKWLKYLTPILFNRNIQRYKSRYNFFYTQI